MTVNTPYPLSDGSPRPAYYALWFWPQDGPDKDDTTVVHPNRYSLYYQGDTVLRNFQYSNISGVTGHATAYEVRALLPSVYGAYTTGDIVKTGSVTATATFTDFYYWFTLGTVGDGEDFPPGAYKIYFTGSLTDTRTVADFPAQGVDLSWGPSYGVSQFSVLRTHPSAVDIRTLDSSFAQNNWKPNGYGRTNGEVDAGIGGGGTVDMILRNALSMPTGRIEMYGTGDNNQTGSSFRINPSLNDLDERNANRYFSTVFKDYYLNPTTLAWKDPARSRTGFSNYNYYYTSYDAVLVQNDGSSAAFQTFAQVYPKNPSVDASRIYVGATVTGGGVTINVYYPDASTLVETYTGLNSGNVSTRINGVSSYVRAWNGGGSGATPLTPTVIGTNCRDQLRLYVQSVGPLGCTRFEVPENEPAAIEEVAHQFWLAQAAVATAGVADAKAMGPSPVNVDIDWASFFAYLTGTAGLTKNDFALAFHDYNSMTGGNLPQARKNWEYFINQLPAYDLDGIEMWQTEGNNCLLGDHGVYMPWRSSEGVRKTLLWEQYGVPRERNPHWYDTEHAFWGDASFIEARGHTTQPFGVLYSVLGQETFGQTHHHRVDMGSVIGNHMFVGSLYGDPLTGSTLVLCCTSDMPSSTVTLTINGTTDPIVCVDGVGITNTETQSSGRITVPVSYIPTYVRLPAGVTASVYSVRDHGTSPNPSVSACYLATSLGGNPAPLLATGTFMGHYTGTDSAGLIQSSSNPPDTAEIKFNQNFAVDRLVVWAAPPYQSMCALINYTVDTWNGTTWTTNTTVTKTVPASFRFGDDSMYGTLVDQLNDGGWVEDVTLAGGPITCKGVRVSVAAASDLTYGGARDALANSIIQGWGGSTSAPRLTLQRMDVVSGTAFSAPSALDATVLAKSPVAYWKFNEAPAATTAASQVNSPALDSTTVSGSTFGGTTVVPSTSDTSLLMANNGYVEVPDNNARHVGDTYSLMAWIEPYNLSLFTANSDGHTLIDNAVTLSGSFRVRVGPYLSLYQVGGGNTERLICKSTATMGINTPYCLLVTKSGSTVHLYLNGQDVSGTVTNFTCSDNGSTLRFGSSGDSAGYYLAHAAIFPTALTATDAANLYRAGVAPSAPTNVNVPFLEGEPRTGSQLQCSMNTTIDWTNNPTQYTYQWQSADDPGTTGTPGVSGMIGGFYPGGWYRGTGSGLPGTWSNASSGTRSDFLPGAGVSGKYLRCLVTASNPAGAATAVASTYVGPVNTVVQLTGYWGTPMRIQTGLILVNVPTAIEADSTDCP